MTGTFSLPIVAMMLITSGCHHHAQAAAAMSASATAESVSDSLPAIDALVPDSIRFRADAAELTIQGRHFSTDDAIGNTVVIGPITLTHVLARANRNQLRVRLPSTWSGSEAPPRAIPPGEHRVSVRTTAGTSNALTLRIVP